MFEAIKGIVKAIGMFLPAKASVADVLSDKSFIIDQPVQVTFSAKRSSSVSPESND
jgi:hypothetical protein